MDLELQKQLIEILKDMHSNASPVFQELLRQYSASHFALAILGTLFTIPSIILTRILFKVHLTKCTNEPYYRNNDQWMYIPIAFSIFLCAVIILATAQCAINGMYPLGGILAKIQ